MSLVSRRSAVATLAVALASGFPLGSRQARAQTATITKDDILNDPGAPVGGNPKGDVTIVAFLDYNCPYCKQSAPDLDRIVNVDGKIRLVYKDWPILSEASVHGAQLALAAKYQNKYEIAHEALMGIPGRRIAGERMEAAIRSANLDFAQLNRDLQAHKSDIEALLRRNIAQADALGLRGTPTYLVGPFRTSTLDYEGFKKVVAEARERQ